MQILTFSEIIKINFSLYFGYIALETLRNLRFLNINFGPFILVIPSEIRVVDVIVLEKGVLCPDKLRFFLISALECTIRALFTFFFLISWFKISNKVRNLKLENFEHYSYIYFVFISFYVIIDIIIIIIAQFTYLYSVRFLERVILTSW